MRHNSKDVACLSCLREHDGESFRHKVKEQGGERVSLSQTPLVAKERPNFTINGDSGLPSGY
jgi:hypothetical protein